MRDGADDRLVDGRGEADARRTEPVECLLPAEAERRDVDLHEVRLHALENERLQAQLRARLEELRSSRARLVEASDAERRRLERNLHDGAQQRLVALSMTLALAQRSFADDK
ncbi:MAG: histidine kinase, partial [Gaiellaceae bacterium]